MKRLRLQLLTTMLTLASISSHNALGQSADGTVQPAFATPVSASSSQPHLQQRYPRYQIQREDVLLIQFPLSPELNQTATVQPDGFITLQSASSIHIQGLTVPQTIEAIKQAYTGILRDPIVNVDLQDFQKPFFSVTGQVGKPGQYELRSDLTVSEAIAVAGGLAPTARQQAFLFHRENSGWYHVEKLDLKDIFNGKRANEDSLLKPGDMIFIPESNITKFRKYVPYGINAGSYLAENQNP